MKGPRAISAVLLAAGIVAGTLADRPAPVAPLVRGPFQVLQADLHVHAFLGDGTLWPWDVAVEARRHGLDIIAVTNHNQVLAARLGTWLSPLVDGALVVGGEEITSPRYHLVAVGIERYIAADDDPVRAIESIHAQGGAAIAAHPTPAISAGWNDAALRELDGAEVCHPLEYSQGTADLDAFFRRFKSLDPGGAAIGSSDYHAFATLGACRTFVFATERTSHGLVEAIRAGRTVAYDVKGVPHGDPALVSLLGPPPAAAVESAPRRILALVSRACALAGLLGLCVFGRGLGRPGRRAYQ